MRLGRKLGVGVAEEAEHTTFPASAPPEPRDEQPAPAREPVREGSLAGRTGDG